MTNNAREAKRRRNFNYQLSKLRIKVEHAFGMLKGRFPSLRAMPGTDLTRIFMAIEALFVIHNILMERGDDPTEIEGYNGVEDLALYGPAGLDDDEEVLQRAHRINGLISNDLYRTGLYRRKLLLELTEIEQGYM